MDHNQRHQVKANHDVERRKSFDFWFVLGKALTLVVWLCFIFALVMSFYAAPEKSYGIVRYHDLEIRRFWLTPLTGYLYLLIWCCAAGSYMAILIDKYRSRRQNDNRYFHLHILLAINLIWLAVILEHVINQG